MSTEKMREEFEVWAKRKAESVNYSHMQFVLAKHENGDYRTTWVDTAWIGWQASRTAIEVDLPEGLTLNELRYGSKPKPSHERLLPRATCVNAIESLGLKVRP